MKKISLCGIIIYHCIMRRHHDKWQSIDKKKYNSNKEGEDKLGILKP